MITANQARSIFLNYFQNHQHEKIESSSLIPHDDPSLLFTNAGMVQFKNVFTGAEARPYKRAVTAQKCLRAGGKHNDLENVGYTARHHTFFEMLGNFSFGDYFKEQAIFYAWELLTKHFELPKEKLLVTVYHDDSEAAQLWKKIAGLPEDKIIRIPTTDNFWSMGDVGPCGPCSEIFYDHGSAVAGGPPGSAQEDGDRFVEIWNLVFMQFEQVSPQHRNTLPQPSIDTGMGLERIVTVLQGVTNNFQIDLFQNLIAASEEVFGKKAKGNALISHRVIADHLRAIVFLLLEGVVPSNEGRGYVLRRIMRRAMRHAHLLGAKEPRLYRLVPALVEEMGEAYPQLHKAIPFTTENIKIEEERFGQTLGRGLNLLQEEINKQSGTAVLGGTAVLDGAFAFKLYDTYGFPLDLTQDILRSYSMRVDEESFDQAMAKQKAEARANWAGSGEKTTEAVWFSLRERIGKTEFLGYKTLQAAAYIKAMVKDNSEVEEARAGIKLAVLVNQTPFYAESGGQVGDTGRICGEGFIFKVEDTQKKAEGLFVHYGEVIEGVMRCETAVTLQVDEERRHKIAVTHSAAHLLHKALSEVLGSHVAQKGSFVEAGRLRFDFSHPKAISRKELKQVELLVNTAIWQNTPIITQVLKKEDALETGATALFGEKYGEMVRVVSMGQSKEAALSSQDAKPWSIELCGGTHAQRTGDIGLIAILGEAAASSGVRRIQAFTQEAAQDYLTKQRDDLSHLASLLKSSTAEAAMRVQTLLEEKRTAEKELAELRKKVALGGSIGEGAKEKIEEIGGTSFLARAVKDIPLRDLKSLVDRAKKQIHSGVVAFINVAADKKATIVIGVTEDLTERVDAVTLAQQAAQVLGGSGGGGRANLAQAGGAKGERAQEALEAVRSLLAKI